MKVLLTGATGFIGHEVAALLSSNHDVYAVARNIQSNTAKQIAEFCILVEDDFSNGLNLEQYPKKIDTVIHCAQSLHYQDFPSNSLDVLSVNVTATAHLLDYALTAGAKSFCHISSGSVYEPYENDLAEHNAITPSSINGCTKAAAEMLVRCYQKHLKTCSLRLFMPYGPGQKDKLLPNLIKSVASNKPITLAQAKGPTVAPIHVKDTAKIIATACEEQWTGTINVAGNESFSLSQMVEMISKLLNRDCVSVTTDDTLINLAPPLGVLQKHMKTSDFITFSTGLSETIQAYLINSKEYT